MRPFNIHTVDTAPPELRGSFERKMNALGFVPNIFAVLAHSPFALTAFEEMNKNFSASSLNATEREIVGLVTSVENGSGYCTAGHSAFSATLGIPDHIVNAIRSGEKIDEQCLQCLAEFTRQMIRSRGQISNRDLVTFFDAGFTQAQVIEVVIGIATKMISNFVSNAVLLPLDEAFKPFEWSREDLKIEENYYQNIIEGK